MWVHEQWCVLCYDITTYNFQLCMIVQTFTLVCSLPGNVGYHSCVGRDACFGLKGNLIKCILFYYLQIS